MSHSNFLLEEPIEVISATDEEGNTIPRQFIWRDKKYTIITVGRQWDAKEGRHILVEVIDGTRFELLLRREDFTWWIHQVWQAQTLV